MQAVQLTKEFPGKLAVSNLNFTLRPGRLTALLGPNGAGKTTTMRLLTGFTEPTSGMVEIQGRDLSEFRAEFQKQIGYLPESGPVYRDLTVSENLDFFAKTRCIPKTQRSRAIFRVIEELNLGEVRHLVIGTLSKGFRQRVALASTLLGDPKYLILDEPSYGLDPNQMTQIRLLIRDLSKDRTVLISTHSLDEVEEICEHVIILSNGRVVANSSVQDLRKQDKLFLVLNQGKSDFISFMRHNGWANVFKLKDLEDGFAEYEVSLGDAKPEDIFLLLSKNQITIREMRKLEESLKTIFNSITGN
ncbi:ABC transporter ATP-binding protein [Leptospira ognonensis]|uniref:ABC transporter ATP-binding protein n=1 Tax=Leptospira ognonensis TaxID=2484945 RepID=A0A4R9K9T2_9LEPT|nr:ABC transporter ATP-binding protein [Leptospira ognonensis]TGL62210.1 ABC transporter ATP-binding protein [Leptospira ognonensis]